MNPAEYCTRWHSFEADLKGDAAVVFVGTRVRSIAHICMATEAKARVKAGVGPAFFGSELTGQLESTLVELEQPIDNGPRSGYCKFCNVLWVSENPNQ